MARWQKIGLVILLAAMVWGYFDAGWTGVGGVWLIATVIAILFNSNQNYTQQNERKAKAEQAVIRLGEMVPAKRGNPDPTRPNPNEELAGLITANWERIKNEIH